MLPVIQFRELCNSSGIFCENSVRSDVYSRFCYYVLNLYLLFNLLSQYLFLFEKHIFGRDKEMRLWLRQLFLPRVKTPYNEFQ